jgi:signal transduction histidine kinase
MTPAQGLRVLLVEDNPTDVLTLEHYLAEIPGTNFQLEHVQRLEAALAFLQNQTCDIVLLDFGLPDSQGIETLTRLRACAADVPIVVLTGLNDESVGLQALQNGAQDYLIKNQVQAPLLGRAIRYAMERHQMERIVTGSEKLQALGTLSGGIAHDFNNIVLAISGNAKLALEQLPGDHAARGFVLEIAKAASRAVALTRKILSFSRQQETFRQAMNLQAVVEEALSLIRPTLSSKIEIRQNFPDKLPPILADAAQIHQIIVNLASNAADAMADGAGQFELSASPVHLNGNGSTLSAKLPPGDYVRLSVRDTGVGMDKKTMAHAFEPFFTTKSQGRGTGMGLAIVHGIMKNHLGEITIYSEPGKGSIFNLYFPQAKPVPAEVLPVPSSVPTGQGQHILYVDDEEPLVLLVTRTLKHLGYRVSGFTNPLEALAELRKNPCSFDAVVTDLSMPQMSGTEFTQEVLHLCPHLPVIITTGYIRPQDQELAQKAGVREVILKPDTVEDLGKVLHRILSGPVLTSHAAAGKN